MTTTQSEAPDAGRRRFIKIVGATAGAAALLTACGGAASVTSNSASAAPASSSAASTSTAASAAAPAASSAVGPAGGGSILDKWVRTKKATLGVDLSFPPIQFKNPKTGKPDGYMMNLTEMMMHDLGVTPEYVQIPFAQLFAAQVAGRFDMMGIAATILPSRALQGLFADFPVFYEENVLLLKPGSNVTKQDQLNATNVTVAVQQGSSQEFSGKLLFPKAKFAEFSQITDATSAVATGRADAVLYSEFDIAGAVKAHPNLKLLPGPAVFVDANTYFMPLNDYKLAHWVTNWLRYQATHQILAGLWNKWVGNDVRTQFHISATVVGPNGDAVTEPPI
ncbi:MAG: substrate-binding periplasmic protein [Chloroflexota bacterium]